MLAITLGACLATGRDPGWDTAPIAALTPPSEGGAPRPVVLGATETSCYVTENNAQLFAALASACAAYEELVVVLNVFDSDDDGQPRSLNCPPELTPNETLPACVRQVTHVPGMKTAFWRDAVRPEDVDRLAPGAEVVWLFDNDMSVGSYDFDLARTVGLMLASNVSIAQPLIQEIVFAQERGEEELQAARARRSAGAASAVSLLQGGEDFGSTSALQALAEGCSAQAVPWVEVQTPMVRVEAYRRLHSSLLSVLPPHIFDHTVWGISHVWCGFIADQLPEHTACAARPNGLPPARRPGCFPTGCAVLNATLATKGRKGFSTIEVVNSIHNEMDDNSTSSPIGWSLRKTGLAWAKENMSAFWPYPQEHMTMVGKMSNNLTYYTAWSTEHHIDQELVRGLEARGECLR